jgi:hypothetical protein
LVHKTESGNKIISLFLQIKARDERNLHVLRTRDTQNFINKVYRIQLSRLFVLQKQVTTFLVGIAERLHREYEFTDEIFIART